MPVVFRPRLNRVMSVLIWAVSGAVMVVGVVRGGPQTLPVLLPWAALAAVTWAVLWQPHVRLDDEEVRLVNVLRTVDVPWPALVHVDTKYALTLHVPGRAFSATAAPAPGRMGAASARRAERRSSGYDGRGLRPGDLLGTDSGQAATLVRERWQRLLDAGAIETGTAETYDVRPRWNVPAVVAIAAAVVLLLLGWTG
ncbi:PH domain-containing protein [Microbacterium betulae]|uniref:PH domain-containing protein n=1 Tax=Microbacterium betulae TaxID=2981139 RepID=A0AA97FJX5_9MICO|nr:PH domain-containing protein [Microbacterium sp. AB]WOF24430.1 PH domain-containing protein [Microbacterium sp. AB]